MTFSVAFSNTFSLLKMLWPAKWLCKADLDELYVRYLRSLYDEVTGTSSNSVYRLQRAKDDVSHAFERSR